MKKGGFLLLFSLILIVSLTAVSAMDNDLVMNESVINDVDYLTFGDLNKTIVENNSISLNKNYIYNSSDENFINGIVINKAVTIDGNGHSIDGNKTARIFYLNSSNILLKNIIFKNAYSASDDAGGAIYITENCNNVTLDNTTFLNNKHSVRAGAVYCNASNSTIGNSNFNKNNALEAGAVYWAGSNGLIEYSTFIENTAIVSGSAVYWDGNSGTITSSKFNKNSKELNSAVFWGAPDGKIVKADVSIAKNYLYKKVSS